MKSIIIATDFSNAAHTAAYYAAHLSTDLHVDTLVIYHSYNNELYITTDVPIPNQQQLQLQRTKSLVALEELQTALGNIIPKSTNIRLETNDQTLLSGIETLIAKYPTEMVVIGTTGKSNLEHVLMGSNAMSLAKGINIPLLLVPANHSFSYPKQAVLACDLKQTEETLPIEYIHHFVHVLNLKLHILNIQAHNSETIADTIPEQYKLHELLDDLDPIYHYIDNEDAARSIIRFASEQHIDLIISIKKNYSFFKDLFHKSITQKLAFKTTLPLLLLGKTIT
ncbi:universal stress protein [Olivibacter sp. CPCC 100613]|uniref:universal stress protein n=1 Tax=Olivibacter sp. CPCC 100613 TaxID=3079931 RepID=UPI002FF85768